MRGGGQIGGGGGNTAQWWRAPHRTQAAFSCKASHTDRACPGTGQATSVLIGKAATEEGSMATGAASAPQARKASLVKGTGH